MCGLLPRHGPGKTFIGSQKLWELNTPYNLVVCQKSQIIDWYRHFKNHYDYQVIVYDKPSKIPPESVVIINYDKLWRRPELSKLRDFTLLLDESSLIQNEKSKRTKFILGLRPDNVILLSGTPTGGKYERLWSQMRLLGWNISKSQFMKQYVEFKPNEFWGGVTILGYRNVDELKLKMKEYGAVFMKTEEVFDLPEQNYIPMECKTTSYYEKFAKNRIVTIDGERLVGDTSATHRMYLRQLAGIRNKHKLDRVEELLESTEDRLLIFYNFNVEYDELLKLVKKHKKPVSVIRGGTVDKTAYETESNSVTLIQYQAGSKGHNLQLANKIIYFSPPDSVENWMQSLKRVHRIGQERPVFYYQMITSGSIDEKIYRALRNGVDYTDELFKKEFNWEE